MKNGRRSKGFTLIELMVVVIILGILAATIIPQFVGTTQDARVAKAKADIATLQSCLERFALRRDNRYPTTEEGLKVLVTPPDYAQPYINDMPLDPWNNPYSYRFPGVHNPSRFDLWSRGADGVDGGEGPNADVTNWREK